VHVIGGADARRLVLYLLFQTLQPMLPVPAVRLSLAALRVCDAGQEKLVGIEFGGGLGDPLALLVQELS
jgi:hypothetical protein